MGVPVIEPLLVLNAKPEGKVGEIEYAFEFKAPPEFVALTVKMEFPTVTD